MNQSAPKIGASHAAGMAALGMSELREILQPLPDSIRAPENPGLFGTVLPQEAYNARHEHGVHGPQAPELTPELEPEIELHL